MVVRRVMIVKCTEMKVLCFCGCDLGFVVEVWNSVRDVCEYFLCDGVGFFGDLFCGDRVRVEWIVLWFEEDDFVFDVCVFDFCYVYGGEIYRDDFGDGGVLVVEEYFVAIGE